MSFADLKRKSQNNFQFLQKELEKSSSGKNVDDRFCCLLYTSPSPRDGLLSRMPSSA